MEKPTIKINGKIIEMPKLKARAWREIAKANEEIRSQKLSDEDFIEKHCAFLASVFGVSVDEVLDNLNIEDVVPLYIEVAGMLNKTLTSKLDSKKNEAVEVGESN